MAETINYGLYIEDDDSVLFKDWREKINGSNNSNMMKIDQALKEISAAGIVDIDVEENATSGGVNKVTFYLASGDSAELTVKNGIDGISDIYVGDGEMPENCRFQILPGSGNTVAPNIDDGGYYTPRVEMIDEKTFKLSFKPNLDGMNEVEDVIITIPTFDPTAELAYVISDKIDANDSVCVIEETGANVHKADNSEYFSDETKKYFVVEKDTYKLDKEAMLGLQSKKLTGNGSVAYSGWDDIMQGWKDTEDASMLSSKLKIRYMDDSVYMSMKLPSESIHPNNKFDPEDPNGTNREVTRPLMRASGNPNPDSTVVYNYLIPIGAIYAPDYTSLPESFSVCIGNMSLYTLSKEENAKWKIHEKRNVPAGYGRFNIPWDSSNELTVKFPDEQESIEVHDNYIKFLIRGDLFAPVIDETTGLPKVTNNGTSYGTAIHFWGDNNIDIDLENTKAVIAVYEIWTETEEAAGKLYADIGADQKNSDRTSIVQNFWGRNHLIQTKKRYVIGHSISDSLYDELRDTPNDPRYVFEDYSTVKSYDFDIENIQNEVDINLQKTEECHNMLKEIRVIAGSINLNDGVYEYGWFNTAGEEHVYSTPEFTFRSKNYIPVDGGREIKAYFDGAEWNFNDVGRSLAVVQYDSEKNRIGARQVLPTVSNASRDCLKLDADTAYIRLAYDKNQDGTYYEIDTPLEDIKVAIYYKEDMRTKFVEYNPEIEYAVDGSKVALTSPNGTLYYLKVSDDGVLSTTEVR